MPLFGATHSPPRAYAYAIALGGAITLVAQALAAQQFSLTNLVMLYLLGVVFAAVRLRRGPGVLLSFLSVAAFDYFFVPPCGRCPCRIRNICLFSS